MFNYNTWKKGEQLAQKYLKQNGYKILETNSKLAGAEVDIVCKMSVKKQLKQLKADYKQGKLLKSAYKPAKNNLQEVYVFVEVKARSSDKFGLPQEAVTSFKQNQIKKYAKCYLKKHKLNVPIRFDVIGVLNSEIDHIVDAF